LILIRVLVQVKQAHLRLGLTRQCRTLLELLRLQHEQAVIFPQINATAIVGGPSAIPFLYAPTGGLACRNILFGMRLHWLRVV
jgi:hypothetical protein